MNDRQFSILKSLYQEKKFITVDTLAKQESVSNKTIRNDLASIREALAEKKAGTLLSKPHIGVKVEITSEEWECISKTKDDNDDEILFFIIKSLLKDDTLTTMQLTQRFYLSRLQTEKVISKAEQWFQEKHISFEVRRGKGGSIKYNEFNYRFAVLDFYKEFTKIHYRTVSERESGLLQLPKFEYTALCGALDGFEADSVIEILTETETEFGISLTYLSSIQAIFLISICILRSRKECEAELPNMPPNRIENESDAKIAFRLWERINEKFGITLSEKELSYLTLVTALFEIQGFASEDVRRNFEIQNVALCRLTVKLVNIVSDIAGVDLREDKFFVTQMFTLLKPMITRLCFGITEQNQLLTHIKKKYPNMMTIAWSLGNVFEKELSLEINDHEAGFLALQIGGAIERKLTVLTACIVCDYGIGVSQILKEKIARTISDLHITSVFSNRDIAKIRKESCDFILTTSPLEHYPLHRDTLLIGHLLDDKDIRAIETEMRKIRHHRKLTLETIQPLSSLFTSELVFTDLKKTDKKALLKELCNKMENLGYVTKDFYKSVMQREETTSTGVGKKFAIPHGLSEYVNHSVVAFASLEKPIQWCEDGEEADLIFLIAFDFEESTETKNTITKFYKSFVAFMEDDDRCNQLRLITDKQKAIELFQLW